MRLNFISSLLTILILSACATSPIQYKVSKVVNGKSHLAPIRFPFGITQEKLDENKYRITAKLNEVDTPKKAHHMAMYHAAVLAQELGFNAIQIKNQINAAWCQSLKSVRTLNAIDATGGPTKRLIVTLLNSDKANKQKRIFLAEPTKLKSKSIIDEVIDKAELEKISAERHEYCFNKANKKNNKARAWKQNIINERKTR
ncbi:hypothetical protein [Colwellia sp. UCD-KL20]|uniref:hypothetical protein n=1 Tax=Colwellia sp. UCD-KL20 TaxID=1917165 RepID=UPI000970353C|nr:hypothetical protein [Colwellia sp. UCD-KL20]